MIKQIWVGLLITLTVGSGADARSRSMKEELLRLSPDERVEQRCNEEAADVIARERKLKAPDEVLAYAFADTKQNGPIIEAPGAAIRDHGEWRHLAYKCRTTPDGLGVVSFEYRLGAKAPRSEWAAHHLSPP